MSRYICTFQSKALLTPTTVQVILPYPTFDPGADVPVEQVYRIEHKFKTLTMLHGAFGSADMWLNLFNIEYFAEKYGLAVVLPSVGNSFYADLQHGPAYWTYITEELPCYLRSVSPSRG